MLDLRKRAVQTVATRAGLSSVVLWHPYVLHTTVRALIRVAVTDYLEIIKLAPVKLFSRMSYICPTCIPLASSRS